MYVSRPFEGIIITAQFNLIAIGNQSIYFNSKWIAPLYRVFTYMNPKYYIFLFNISPAYCIFKLIS